MTIRPPSERMERLHAVACLAVELHRAGETMEAESLWRSVFDEMRPTFAARARRLLRGGRASRLLTVDDLLSEAALVVLPALTRFDPDRGVSALTFLTRSVMLYWRRVIAQARHPLSVAINQRDRVPPVVTESVDHAPAAARCPGPLETVLRREALSRLASAVAALPDRERTVITARFGLDASPERTLRDLMPTLGVSLGTVANLETRAMARLRSHLKFMES